MTAAEEGVTSGAASAIAGKFDTKGSWIALLIAPLPVYDDTVSNIMTMNKEANRIEGLYGDAHAPKHPVAPRKTLFKCHRTCRHT